MINAAMVGLGWWGKTLVEAVQHVSDDIRFVAATTATLSAESQEFSQQQGITLQENYEALLNNPDVDAVVLATPNAMHVSQILKAAEAGKHVFCEKPLSLDKAGAQKAVAAMQKAGVTLAVGYNRRLHPAMIDLKQRIETGALGTILHFEGSMCFPNALYLKPDAWRANSAETPCGGLAPMGVHVVDAAIDLFGDVEEVFCLSKRRAVEVDVDDTTSIIFNMKNGVTGYLSTLTATAGNFQLQVFGSKGWIRLEGMTHIAGAPSEDRRTRLFGKCTFQPVKGEVETWEAEPKDLSRAALDAFAIAAAGGPPYPVSDDEMVHCVAVTETIIKSSETGLMEKII